MKTIWTWSPEARTQLRNIDPENAMRILLALTRLADTLSYSAKIAPSRSRLGSEPRALASGLGYVSELLK